MYVIQESKTVLRSLLSPFSPHRLIIDRSNTIRDRKKADLIAAVESDKNYHSKKKKKKVF